MARLTSDSLKCVREALYDVRNSWYDIGVELDVGSATLDNIKTQSDNNSECLREMLKVWLKGLDCSWKDIVTALKCKALREITGALATEIEKEYCTEAAVVKAASNTTGSIQEGMVAELHTELKKLKMEVSALKTQKKLDQGDFSTVAELNPDSGIDISAKGSFIITSDKAHVFELKRLGLRMYVPKDALPPGVTKTTVHVQVSLSDQYYMPDSFELASAVYWFSSPVERFSHPVTVEIQHNAASGDPSLKLCYTICKFPKGMQFGSPYTFKKMEGGRFTRHNGSIDVPGYSGLAIIMPNGGPQYYLSQLWYAKKSERDWSVYYVITKDLVAFKTAVEACYSDEAYQDKCVRVDFEGSQVMMDIPMQGIRTEEWAVTPLYSPVILKEDANSFSSGRLPVCELAVQWEGTSALDMPARFTLDVNLLGAKAPGSVVLDIKTGAPQYYLSQLWYAKKSGKAWSVYYVITKDLVALKSAVEAYYSNGALQGRCERVDFEGDQIMLDIPMNGIRTEKWKITPVYNPAIQKEDTNSFSSGRLPVCELAVTWEGTYTSDMPDRFTYTINLLGVKAPGSVVLDITTLAFEPDLFKLFYNFLDDYSCDVHWTNESNHYTDEKYVRDLGALEGPKMEVFFQSPIISLEIPAAVSGWRIIPVNPKLQISREVRHGSSVQFRVKRDTNTQEPLDMDIPLKGARPPNNFIRIFLDPSVWGAQKSSAISIQQQKIQEEELHQEEWRKEERRQEAQRRKEERRQEAQHREEERRQEAQHREEKRRQEGWRREQEWRQEKRLWVERRWKKQRQEEQHREKWFLPGSTHTLMLHPVAPEFSSMTTRARPRRKRSRLYLEQSSSSLQSPSVTTLPSPSGKQSTSHLQDSKKWYQLGIQLDIDHEDLDAIGKACTDDEEKLICVLYKWMHSDESLESIKRKCITR